MDVPCFMIEPTGRRRAIAHRQSDRTCPGTDGDATCRADLEVAHDMPFNGIELLAPLMAKCDRCGGSLDDSYSLTRQQEWSRPDTGEVSWRLNDFGAGAMFYGDEWDFNQPGPDGHSLHVLLPNLRIWRIDSQARNCGMPDDVEQEHHHCWIRHGTPPLITVDKDGVTCSAGAGSIGSGEGTTYYHGYLRNGVLVDA